MLRQAAPAVPLFGPRVAAHVIAVLLPEARQVLRQELEAPDPLGALPEVEVRYEEPRRPAVLGSEPLAAPLEGDEILRPVEVGERQVRREPLLGRHETIPRVRLHPRALE